MDGDKMSAIQALKARRQASAASQTGTTGQGASAQGGAAPSTVPPAKSSASSGAIQASTSGASAPSPVLSKSVRSWAWSCTGCNGRECIPIRTESRCLCGHRMKEHAKLGEGGSEKSKCLNAKCNCPGFYFIVAEGSWILRCRCKHKHIEHDPVTHKCVKKGCGCECFDSPWVCNCNHPWGEHKQQVVDREMKTLEGMMAAADLGQQVNPVAMAQAVASSQSEINDFGGIKRGLD